MRVEVVRSKKRRKTISALQVGDDLVRVSIPASLSRAEEEHWVEEMLRRFTKRALADRVDLDLRARQLAEEHGFPTPRSVRWVDNQTSRWGSCTPADATIRLSSRMVGFPRWVIDAVLVHELAHLVEPRHNTRFDALCARYPMSERATGYLLAKGFDGD
ncbi:MAG TPA: YgjP-like metallopeptidase domain-containing protein [Acidimicrobiales bacterium]|nr:YgjP-like metallopeptidase domain-containing protein [Acidimicrobiales bacterium]